MVDTGPSTLYSIASDDDVFQCQEIDRSLLSRIRGVVHESDVRMTVERWKSLHPESRPCPVQTTKEMLLNALMKRRCTHGPDHLDTLALMHTLALFLVRTGSHAEGQQMCRSVAASYQRSERPTFGFDVSWVLAQSLVNEGKFDEAEAVLWELLPVVEHRMGRGFPLSMNCRRTLILALASQRRYEVAWAVLQEGYAICRTIFPRRQSEEISLLNALRQTMRESVSKHDLEDEEGNRPGHFKPFA